MEYIVELDKLEIGRHHYDFQIDSTYFAGLENTELLGGNVNVKAELNLHESSFTLHMQLDGTVQITCDRCLDAMNQNVNVDDDIDMDDDTSLLDLKWLAYEQIIINLPIVHSHPEGGCNPQMAALLQNHLCSTLEEPEIIEK